MGGAARQAHQRRAGRGGTVVSGWAADAAGDDQVRRLQQHLATMWRIRMFEERVRDLRMAGQIAGSVHLCIGQEAIPAGACSALRDGDPVFATYRGHGWALACGVPATPLLAELLGRAAGVNGGRGGSAFFSAPRWGFYGENSIVGAGGPIATGAALAGRYDGSGRVVLCAFGDGAVNQGALHEALNFAAAFRLPVVFVCENNRYSELTPIGDMVAEPELWRRAAGYGMPGQRVDGNDPLAVEHAVAEAVGHAAAGEGPSFLEAMTQRLVGHYVGDLEQYRPAGEVEAACQCEPLVRAEQSLASSGIAAGRLDAIRAHALDDIDAAAGEALAAPPADARTVREHVYA
jgi:TPP-dependent pyruvate/acetoin dehydrogenase alpha subunit